MEKIDAIATAGATASRTVFFSGMAVAIALAGMLIMPDATFRSFAVGAILVVIATVVASMTLLPAVLGPAGRPRQLADAALHRPSRAGPTAVAASGTGSPEPSWRAPSSASSLRAACSSPPRSRSLDINLGSVGISSLPENSNARHAFDVINREFSDGVLTADIVIDAPERERPGRAGRDRPIDRLPRRG